MSKLSQLRKKLKKSKWLYEFEVKDLQEVEETEDSVNEKGEKVSITRKIKKVVPVSIKILRPFRFAPCTYFRVRSGVRCAEVTNTS